MRILYSSLHNHSEYSLLDGFAKPEEYFKRASEIGLKAFAITEHGNQYSWVYFDKIKKNYPDIKMIFGIELYECFDMSVKDENNKYFHLIALAKNENGRKALNSIVTKSNFEGFYYKPRVDITLLRPYANDLIILTACLASKLSREKNYKKCIEYVNEYNSIFPYFYLEMQSQNNIEQEEYNKKILKLSADTDTPFVITTDSHVAYEEDLKYQARHVQIAHDSDTISEAYDGCYLQSEEEIHKIMDKQIGIENVNIGLEETNKIADLIEFVEMPFQKPKLPKFKIPESFKSELDYLKYLCKQGWERRNINNLPLAEIEKRKERLNYEIEIINQMGYVGYFLIVWDFVNYAKSSSIMVGDGRGSGGGSFVNYLLGISELDPIKYDLIFERFLNPERVSMPDIDLDFSDKAKIVEYLSNKYGVDNVCQIINFSYITPVVAIKDVGKVLKIPYFICDKISKKFTNSTFDECLANNTNILIEYKEYEELFEIASKISGRVRHASIHAGGVGIVDTSINDFMGMKVGSDNEHIIQVDKVMVEEIGIIKFDILGVSTLSVLQNAMKYAGIKPEDLSIDNPDFFNNDKMYELLQSGRTNGVFQVESQGMKDLLLQLKPTNLEDVSAILALYRPDSMPMLEDYIYYKHHEDEIKYWHTDMIPILNKTYGCIIYQEQIMDIVRTFGGRSYGGADQFRRGIGKKNVKLIQEESSKLKDEIIQNNYPEELAEKISSYLATMGGYSFNKSHSALYSILALKTAYLKANYPLEFFCALLNQNRNNFGILNKYIVDAISFGIEILPPEINKSIEEFTIYKGKILFGLSAIKDIGENIVRYLLAERQKGVFTSLEDLNCRLNLSKTQVVALIKSGAIPCKDKMQFLKKYAKSLYKTSEFKEVTTLPKLSVLKDKYNIDTDIVKTKEERLRLYNKAKYIEHKSTQEFKFNKHMNDFENQYLQEEAFWEFETLSIFLNHNPFNEALKLISHSFDELPNNSEGVIVGVIANITKKKDRHGKQFAFISLYSVFGLIEITCWHTQFKRYEELLCKRMQVSILYKKKDDKAIVKEVMEYKEWLSIRKDG